MTKFSLQDVQFLGAMGPPGGGRNDVSTRMTRHLNIITIHEFSDATDSYFLNNHGIPVKRGGYESSYLKLTKQAVSATLQVSNNSIQTFLPTPSKSHYLFNLRDFSRVILGCLQLKSNLLESSDKFIRIWVHESYRVFADRLVDISDQERFFEIVKDATSDNFKCSLEKVLSHLSQERVTEREHNFCAC